MKIAVTVRKTVGTMQVDPQFGRAEAFLIVDLDDGTRHVHDNVQNLNAVQGAGIQAARNVAELGAQCVLTGHVGPKAFATLQAAEIKVYLGASGSVDDALAALRESQLSTAQSADKEGHWAG